MRRIFAAALVLAGTVPGVVPAAASAATCPSWSGPQPPSPGDSNQLTGVTVLSPCDAWAVGYYFSSGSQQTLIEHWNGAAWTVVTSPSPGTTANILYGVRARSSSDIWAVGAYNHGDNKLPLIERWNGHAWKQVAGPSAGANSRLVAVRAVSAGDAWAVGSFG